MFVVDYWYRADSFQNHAEFGEIIYVFCNFLLYATKKWGRKLQKEKDRKSTCIFL